MVQTLYHLSRHFSIFPEEFKMARIIDGNKMNLVGKNVKKYRKKKKMSQMTLSEKLELFSVYICRGSISRVEDQSRTVTDIELFALAKVLGVSIENLFEGTECTEENDSAF